MLPPWMRSLGAAGLAALGTLIVLRMVNFYRHRAKPRQTRKDGR
jgi:hypothetical protein